MGFTFIFQVPRSRPLPLPNHQTHRPTISPARPISPPRPQAPPSPSARVPDPRVTSPPHLPVHHPHSRAPHPGVTRATSPQFRHPATRRQSLRRSPRRRDSPAGTSRWLTPHLPAPPRLQTRRHPPLTPRTELLLRPLTSRVRFPDRGLSPNPGADPASHRRRSPLPRPATPTGSAPVLTSRWVRGPCSLSACVRVAFSRRH